MLLTFIILGIIQGITEPLPISSSGHLIIMQNLLGFQIQGMSFEAFINFGSTIAILIYFKNKIIDLIEAFLMYLKWFFQKYFLKQITKSEDKIKEKYQNQWNYILKIIVATLPLVIVGIIIVLTGYDGIENIKTVAYALLLTGISLLLVNKVKGHKNLNELTIVQILIIGIFQSIAFLPGISRSGMTLIGALLVGLKNKEAFEFSFIMFIPASLGALLLSIIEIAISSDLKVYFSGYLIALLMAGIFTYLGLIVLKKLVVERKLFYFSIYCFTISGLILIFYK